MSTARERTQEWLDSQQDELESIAESSVVDSLDDYKYSEHTFTEQEDDDDDDEETGEEVSTIALGTRTVGESVGLYIHIYIYIYLAIILICLLINWSGDSKGTIIRDTLRDLLNSINSIQTVGNVNISNSTNVHIGNVTNINGNIQIIAEATPPPRPRNMRRERRKVSSADAPNVDEVEQDQEEEETEERVSSDVFISRQSN